LRPRIASVPARKRRRDRRRGPIAVLSVALLCLLLTPEILPAVDLEDLLWDLQIVPLDGQPAPAFTLDSLDGKKVSLSDFRSKPVLLYFWATW